jgi:hypothetical protein
VIKGESKMDYIHIVSTENELEVNVANEIEQEFGIQISSASRRFRRFHTSTHTRYHLKNTISNAARVEDFRLRAADAMKEAIKAKSLSGINTTTTVIDYKSNAYSELVQTTLLKSGIPRIWPMENYSFIRICVPDRVYETLVRKFGIENILKSIKSTCNINFGFISGSGTTHVENGEFDENNRPVTLPYRSFWVCDVENRERVWNQQEVQTGIRNAIFMYFEKQTSKVYKFTYGDLVDLGVIDRSKVETLTDAQKDGLFTMDLGL